MGVELDSKDGHARKRDVSKRKRAGPTQRKKASKKKNYRKSLSQWRDEINEPHSGSEDDCGKANNLQTYWQSWAAETLAVLEESYTGFTVLWDESESINIAQERVPVKSVYPSPPSSASAKDKQLTDIGSHCEQDCGCCGQQALAVMLDSKGGHARKRDVCRRKRNESIQRKKLGKKQNYHKTSSRQRNEISKHDDSDSKSDCKTSNNLHEYWENWAAETLAALEENYTGFTVLWNQDAQSTSSDPQTKAVPLSDTSLRSQSPDTLPSSTSKLMNEPDSMPVESLSDGEQEGRCGHRRKAVDSKRDASRRKRHGPTQRKKSAKRQNYRKTTSQWRNEINERDDSDSDYNDSLAVDSRFLSHEWSEASPSALLLFPQPLSASVSAPLPYREVFECVHGPSKSPRAEGLCNEACADQSYPQSVVSQLQEQMHEETSISIRDQVYQKETHDQVNLEFKESDEDEQTDSDDDQLDEERDETTVEESIEPLNQQSELSTSLQDAQEQVLREMELSGLMSQLQSLQSTSATEEIIDHATFEQTELYSHQLDIAQLESRLLELTAQDEPPQAETDRSLDVKPAVDIMHIDAVVPPVPALEESSSVQIQESKLVAELRVASPSCKPVVVSVPPPTLSGWTSAVLLKMGVWVSGLFGTVETKTPSGGVVRVGAFTVKEVLHESDRCSVVVAKPSMVEEKERVACKLTAEATHLANNESFALSPIGLEWQFYSHLQQGPCPDGVGCRHDLLLKAYSAMAGVECWRPDGSVYCTNLLVLEEAATSLDNLLMQGPLPEALALALFEDVLSAVDTLHRHKICHRDLKPCQVLFSKEGKLKLADLDTACFFKEFKSPQYLDTISQGSEDEWMLDMLSDGTLGWQAPEVAAWNNWTWEQARPAYYGVATAADIWGCGLILLCLLLGTDDSGEAPLPESIADPRLPAKARELLAGLLAVNPSVRMDVASARQFLAQYWSECGRSSVSELTTELVSRLQRSIGEDDGWTVIKDDVGIPEVGDNGLISKDQDNSWSML